MDVFEGAARMIVDAEGARLVHDSTSGTISAAPPVIVEPLSLAAEAALSALCEVPTPPAVNWW